MSELVRVERGRVAVVTLDRPEQRNALNGDMVEALLGTLDDIAKDEGCRAVLLQGRGKHFCAGADFADVSEGAAKAARYGGGFEALLRAVEKHPLPLVAKVRGAALGAGCQILAAADLAVAARDARIGIPSARLGILLDLEKIERMVREIGPARTRQLLFTGEPIDGDEAAAWGLVTRAVPDSDLDDAARALAEQVASGAPISVRGSKAGIRRALRHGALERERDAEVFAAHDQEGLRALTSEDLAEGLCALREKRPPEFRGR